MITEPRLSADVTDRFDTVVRHLVSIAPQCKKCIFLNLEMRDAKSDNAISPDLFAVVRPWFGPIKREPIEVNWDTANLLMSLGEFLLTHWSLPHLIIDIIINKRGQYKIYKDDGRLRRLAGGDKMYRSKYREYVGIEPWLAELGQLNK